MIGVKSIVIVSPGPNKRHLITSVRCRIPGLSLKSATDFVEGRLTHLEVSDLISHLSHSALTDLIKEMKASGALVSIN